MFRPQPGSAWSRRYSQSGCSPVVNSPCSRGALPSRGLATISPQMPDGCVKIKKKLASCLKELYFFFRFIKIRKKNLHGIGHMTQGDHFLWLPGHTHTLLPHHGHHVYDSHDTLTTCILDLLVILYLVCWVFSVPSFLDHLCAVILCPFILFFYYYLSTDSCLLFRQMQFWENEPRQLRRPCVWQVFPVDFSVDW